MILNKNNRARLQAFTEARKHGIYIPGMFIVETGDQNVGWVGEKTWIFCSHVICALAFQIEILIQNCARYQSKIVHGINSK